MWGGGTEADQRSTPHIWIFFHLLHWLRITSPLHHRDKDNNGSGAMSPQKEGVSEE